ELLVATDFGPSFLTTSGYSMTVRRWKRGTPLVAAPELLCGLHSDVSMTVSAGNREGLSSMALIGRHKQFVQAEHHLLGADGVLRKIDLPEDADAWLDMDWLMVLLRTPWTVGGRTFAEGSLV